MTERERKDFGPTIEPSARRDPELSIGRHPPRPVGQTYYRFLGWTHAEVKVPAAARNLGFALLAIVVIVAATVFLGFAAHAIWDALHLGWRLTNG